MAGRPRKAVQAAERRQKDPNSPPRILHRQRLVAQRPHLPGRNVEDLPAGRRSRRKLSSRPAASSSKLLDLSRLTSEYGRVIYPCKACVSTAMPLCHWPCSCYPNHALGQTGDWMNEIYPKWVAAHGVMIVCPVNWYQAPSLAQADDRPAGLRRRRQSRSDLDGGKDPRKRQGDRAQGWPYPRHLAGRVFSVVVHGDAAGAENLRRMLSDWLQDIGLIPAGHLSRRSTAMSATSSPTPRATTISTSDQDLQEDVRNAARALVQAVKQLRRGELLPPDRALHESRPK